MHTALGSSPRPLGSHFSDVEFKYGRQGGSGHSSYITISDSSGGLLGIWNAGTGWQHANTDPMSNGHALTTWLDCAGNCPHAPVAHTYIKDLYFTIQDYTAPEITALGGSVFAGGVRRGSETIEVTGSDGQGGVTGAVVKVNGVVVANPDAPCPSWGGPASGPARSFRPCVSSFGWTLVMNTEDGPWADGENVVEVCVEDLSFDQAASRSDCATRTVMVDNSCPSSGGAQASSIEAGLQGGGGAIRSAIRIRSDRGATVRGTLVGPGRVGGSTVCLYEQVDMPGDGRELVDTTRVRSDGSFALDVTPGPSRIFDVVYRYNNQIVERKRLYLDSVVVPAFRVVGRRSLLNGQNVRFRGLIPGPNADGRGISLQARAGRKWRTFKQVRANSKGEFRGLYRFTQTQGRRPVHVSGACEETRRLSIQPGALKAP